MAQYGYRLFKTERMNGRGNTPVAFMDGKWGDFVEHLTRSYERQIGRKWHENPRDAFDSNGNAVPLDPNSRIVRLDWMHRSGMSVFFAVSSGKNDGFRDAMTAADGAADVSIEHLAPRRQYRGVFTLPPNQAEGIVALETISRTCLNTVLTRWSNEWSEQLAKADGKSGKESHHCRVRFNQITDSAQITSLLNEGDPQEIVLTEHVAQGNGLPNLVQYRLTAPVREKHTVMGTIKRWVTQKGISVQDGIQEARALVGPEVAEVDFDECYVSVRHEGQLRHVSPDAYSELFTYDIRSKQRETNDFYREVNNKMAALGFARTMDLDLNDWPTDLPSL
ncbi:hypothetical protein LQ424_06555 [Rhodococcus qingshengii]|nr:hypothetical protein [Rhodococcus qingshengii]MCD2131439.1 hypothetical protein [Rhodococcus qingshengii]